MIIYVTVGGMKGTTYVQIVKAVHADGRRPADDRVLVLRTSGSTCPPCSAPRPRKSGKGDGVPRAGPGLRQGRGRALRPSTTRSDLLSLGIALVLGTAGLPHILIRFYTVPTAKAARKSVLWAIGIIGRSTC